MSYSGLNSDEVWKILGFNNRQMLKQSGIGDAIHKQYPYKNRNLPLYDEEETWMWKRALDRRLALIAFGKLNDKSSLLNAIDIDPDEALDCECAKCHGWAYAESIDFKRAWCVKHGVVGL